MASLASPQQNIDPQTTEKAIKALLKWRNAKQPKSQNHKLFDQNDDDFIYLIVTLKKVPQKCRTNVFKIPLPHAIHEANASECCLIVHDSVNKNEVTKKIEQEKIPISKVIKLSKLKSDYKAFEDKRKLCGSFDVFLADKRVVNFLPKLLGRCFYKRRKVPVSIDLGKKDWKREIESNCRSGMLYLRTGTCCVVKVGRLSMGVEELVENVVEGINGVADVVPSKWGNVRSFHLKLLESLALPVYQAVPDVRPRIEGLRGKKGDGEVEEENKYLGKRKGKIQDVRHMDWDDNVLSGDDDFGSEDSEGEGDELDLGKLLDKMRNYGGEKDGVQNDRTNLLNN